MRNTLHQYIQRDTGQVQTEKLYMDRVVRFFYSDAREELDVMQRLLTGPRSSRLLGYLNYDTRWGSRACRNFVARNHLDLSECLEDPAAFDTVRKFFERRIRYWERRPMPESVGTVVSPADARVVVGSLEENSQLFLKGKFFGYEELLAQDKPRWLDTFRDGDYAIFRLTPEKYHYNHTPVAGMVEDYYEIPGLYHSCNPAAVTRIGTPYSKNKRVVTIINTDVGGGSYIGRVAMIEVVALMIGEILQCYSRHQYFNPTSMRDGLFMRRGQPKSLFRPGSSTTLLLFEKNRIAFAEDLLQNQAHPAAESRFSVPFGRTLVETDVKVRSLIARPRSRFGSQSQPIDR
jgi:phosphatidylserine decarboxylase